jgi:hypothetical protein
MRQRARNVVFQFQLAKRLNAVPVTRDYMLEAELREEAGSPFARARPQ